MLKNSVQQYTYSLRLCVYSSSVFESDQFRNPHAHLALSNTNVSPRVSSRNRHEARVDELSLARMGALVSCFDCFYPRGERPLSDAERQEVAHARGRAAQAAEDRCPRGWGEGRTGRAGGGERNRGRNGLGRGGTGERQGMGEGKGGWERGKRDGRGQGRRERGMGMGA
ncbi:unnamed protein product, partial [Closterium sp. NIES-53]